MILYTRKEIVSLPNVKKLIEKMKQQPNGMRPEEIDKVLVSYGYIPVRQKGVITLFE